MGAWGFQAFENDDAMDWLMELEAGGAEAVREGLRAGTAGGYIDAPEGSVAIAAAEITAAAQGRPAGDLPDNATTWVSAHGAALGAEDAELALQAVQKIGGDESELAELWVDADEPEWKESLADLTERLSAALK